MSFHRSTTRATAPATELAAPPRLGAILKHLALSLLMANIAPGLLFYLCLRAGNVWTALIAALAWCYGTMAWRIGTKRRTSALLLITVIGLTVKTIIALVSGSTFIYFVQPAVNDGLVAILFLLSLATARPIVARLAHDFFPLNDEVAKRPRIQRLFCRLTILWALICLIKCAVTLWMLESMPLVTFVTVKSILVPAVIVSGAAVTVVAAHRVARIEGLLHRRPALAITS